MSLDGELGEGAIALQPDICLEPGPVSMEIPFVGGDDPRPVRLQICGSRVLDLTTERFLVDGDEVALPERPLDVIVATVERVANALADVRVTAHAHPDGDVLVRFKMGVEIVLADGVAIRVTAAANGTPTELKLSVPVDMRFDGRGMRLSHKHARGLLRAADIRLLRATLTPDGAVSLEGAGARALNTAVQGGLHLAASRLTEVIRHSPSYGQIRGFLRV